MTVVHVNFGSGNAPCDTEQPTEQPSASSNVPAGYVQACGGTIGSSASSATNRANDDTKALFMLLWDSGWPVVGGPGNSAVADWRAHKSIEILNLGPGSLIALEDGNGGPVGTIAYTFVDRLASQPPRSAADAREEVEPTLTKGGTVSRISEAPTGPVMASDDRVAYCPTKDEVDILVGMKAGIRLAVITFGAADVIDELYAEIDALNFGEK